MNDSEQQKQDFLARCANAFDAGLCTPERLRLLDKWIDAVMRFEGGQTAYFADFVADESRRTTHFHPSRTLANDVDGYALVQIAAILNHPCQTCATDPKAWWTRAAFCDHKRDVARQMGGEG